MKYKISRISGMIIFHVSFFASDNRSYLKVTRLSGYISNVR